MYLFAEPLYQVYAADVLSEMRRKSEKTYKGEEDMFSEYSTGSIEAGQRLLWCQLPSVRDSGVLDTVEPRERKRQEVRFGDSMECRINKKSFFSIFP